MPTAAVHLDIFWAPGGAVRLGRAISLGLATAGYDLVVHFRSSEGPAREVAREVEALGRRCVPAAADLADPDGPRLLAEAAGAMGRLDLLVNSAASFDASLPRKETMVFTPT